MSLTDEERDAIVQYRVEKALNALNDIHKILPMEVWATIANRMYYALYYAVSALLIKDGHKVSSHKGVISLYNLYYIKTGILSLEDGGLFGSVFAFRQGSDYDDFIDASEKDVKEYLPQVETLVKKIISLINEQN
jgi:uncharacterized protein (UPF0332 family)